MEKGWGDNSEHILDMIDLLLEVLQAPEPSTLEMFLVGIPIVFNHAILSPHGYFGKENVLIMPDKTSVEVNKFFIIAMSIP